ncbi:MAG TPA: YkgJ family cysteine cluster protein [Cyanobacteria bacterium UBA8156]|nr:YkgJ family cysteine cluster protein [Cyanobacteria bacterium UBA8156]
MKWQCMRGCGACCHLDPADRPDLADYLTPAELDTYLAMVGPDGWCRHYDRAERTCTIYGQRPRFCRVTPATFHDMFGVPPAEFEDFAIRCCLEQIAGVYGDRSLEDHRYRHTLSLL